MRPDEEFVARCLVRFLGGPSAVSVADGEDPPDFYLSLARNRIGVEVTRLSESTVDSDGTIGNRATEDEFGVRVIKELDAKLGPCLPRDVNLLLNIRLPVPRPKRFRSSLMAWGREVATSAKAGARHEREIEGSETTIWVIPRQPTGKRITGSRVEQEFLSLHHCERSSDPRGSN
jgi:hypothetical protein